MRELILPWQELSVLIPLIGAIVVRFINDNDRAYRWSVALCSLALAFAVGEWVDFGMLQAFEAHDHWDFLPGVVGADALQ